MDVVWTRGARNDLKTAFPKNNNGSRILLTSRNREVAVHAIPYSLPHFPCFLNNDENWELLEKKVFRKESYPPELEVLGKKITKECCGLPLAIVMIARLFMKKEKTYKWWEKVAKLWTRGARNDHEMAFPKNNNGSGILLTSRNREVAVHANPYCLPHFPCFLNNDESWELLEKKVFRKKSCPPKLEVLGKQIVKECCGLPLAIVFIAGLFMKNEKTCKWWEKMAKSVSSNVASDPK
ncbi:hypothetical protein U1Q18_001959 [Sarracenia purpurea var. burkii]